MIFAEIIVLLGAIYLGVRLGGIAIGYAGGLGVVALTLLGLKAGNIPWDVILIIMSVIAAITAMQEAGGLDYLVKLASNVLRRHPKHINFLAPTVTWLLTVFAGTGHTAFSMIPVITEVAKGENIRPCVPLSIAVVASQIAITASPVSAAVVFMASDLALGGLGIDYPTLLLIWIPTTYLGCMLTAFIMNIFCKMDLSKDPEYIRRLEAGEVSKAVKHEEMQLKPHAKRSVLIFLIGVLAVVFYASAISNNVGLIKPSVITGYETVYEQEKPELQIRPLDSKHPEHVPPMAPSRGKKLELHVPAHRRKRHRVLRPRHEADQVEQRNEKKQNRRDYRRGRNERKNEHSADEGPVLPFAERVPCLAAVIPRALHSGIRAPWGWDRTGSRQAGCRGSRRREGRYRRQTE